MFSLMYFVQAHPVLSDMERKKVCSLMDCQKLSREACAHAAQNDRLPVQTVVQVLYYEQQRIREVMDGSLSLIHTESAPPISVSNTNSIRTNDMNPEITSLKRENADLKIELVKMKMKVREMERSSTPNKSAVSSPVQNTTTTFADKPPLPRKSFINSVSKKLGRLSPFGVLPYGAKGRTKPPKDRRHSIS